MKPYIITIASQKGGAGKTVTATNLAHGLILNGYKTLLADADKQGTARDWSEANEAKIVPVIGMDRDTLAKDIEAIQSGYDAIIIDTPPRISKLTASAIRISDLVIIPIQPSPYDIWAVAETVEIVNQRREVTGDETPKCYFLITQERKNTNLSKMIDLPLNEYGFPILKSKTTAMVWYKESAAKGLSVFEKLNSPACKEFTSVVEEIIEIWRLHGCMKSC